MADTATAPFHGTLAYAGFAPSVVQSSNVYAVSTGSIAATGFAPTVIEGTYWTTTSAASTTWAAVEF